VQKKECIMKQRIAFAFTCLILAALVVPFAMLAQSRPGPKLAADRNARTAVQSEAQAVQQVVFRDRLAARSGPVKILVELAAAPVTVQVAQAIEGGMSADAAASEGQAQLARIELAQDQLLNGITAIDSGARTIFQVQRVYNGVALTVDASALAAIQSLPSVKAIHQLPTHTLDNASSVPLIGAPDVWRGTPGATGKTMKVGIIDTGIDYHHVNFGGPGNGYELNNTQVLTDAVSVAYFGANALKVKGGFDFVGDDYDGDNVPAPDLDPMDCLDPTAGTVGHGTHVAGTAAGFGTTSAGARFTGPYTSTIDFANLRIGPGVAPEADLYALRVFGCEGSTNLVIQAIEWSVDPNGDGNTADRLDVINMSLGSDYGTAGDSTDVASDNAAKAGVIVVASAGNSSNTHYIHGSPGTSSYTISVASSDDGSDIVDGFDVNSPQSIAGVKVATFSSNYDWATEPDVTGDLIYIPGVGTSTGCGTTSPYTAGQLAGKVVLVDWAPEGTSNFPCGSGQRTNNAAGAGAIGIIIASGQPFFDTAIAGNALIPAVFTTFTVGAELKAAAGTVNVTFSNSYAASQSFVDPALVNTLSGFSSRGPRGGDSALKPDLAAPGQSIFSTDFNSGNGGKSLNGTSMAAPHVAGMMALLRQLKPTLSVTQLKALAMNTAVQDVYVNEDGALPFHAVQRVGAGRVVVPRAAAGSVIVYNSDQPELVSLSFGVVEVVAATTLTKTLTVRNLGANAANYSVSYVPDSSIPGVSYVSSPASVSVAAGGTATISVAMSADPAQMKHLPDELLEAEQGASTVATARHYIAEAAGAVELYATAPTTFYADILGRNEVPPVLSSTKGGLASFSYDTSTNTLGFEISFTEPISLTMSHLHRGPSGKNGPVAVSLLPVGAYAANTAYPGTATLSDADEALLLAGGLYANFHTTEVPAGEIRGQVVPQATPDLRVGVYATARHASTMAATPEIISFGNAATGTAELSFAGAGLNTGSNLPVDLLSVATVFELQYTSSNGSTGIGSKADLAAVGVTSSYGASTPVVSSTLYFGVATHDEWSSPNTVEFDVYIDTNGSGVDEDGVGAEYILFTSSTGTSDANDVFVTVLVNRTVTPNTVTTVDVVNAVPADVADTQPFNSNVLVLPVDASLLGLTNSASAISYRVFSFENTNIGFVEDSGLLRYDLAKPGLAFSSAAAVAGPAYRDLDGTKVAVGFTKANFDANRSKGVLIFHHHNGAGSRVETTLVNPKLYLPLIRR